MPKPGFKAEHLPVALNVCIFDIGIIEDVKRLLPDPATPQGIHASSLRYLASQAATEKLAEVGYTQLPKHCAGFENKMKPMARLTYHVVLRKVMAADFKTMKAKTVNGQELDIQGMDDNLPVDKANLTKTDIAASNGVVHVIDTFVMPK